MTIPSPPPGWSPATVIEARTTDEGTLRHNRRLGWLLHLAALGILPDRGTPSDQLVALVRLHLPAYSLLLLNVRLVSRLVVLAGPPLLVPLAATPRFPWPP